MLIRSKTLLSNDFKSSKIKDLSSNKQLGQRCKTANPKLQKTPSDAVQINRKASDSTLNLSEGEILRNKFENEYKMQVTRSINDNEIKSKIPENIVDKFLNKQIKELKYHSNISREPTRQSSFHSSKSTYLLPDLLLKSRNNSARTTSKLKFADENDTEFKSNESNERRIYLNMQNEKRSNSEMNEFSQISINDRRSLIHSAPISRSRVKFQPDSSPNINIENIVNNNDSFSSKSSPSIIQSNYVNNPSPTSNLSNQNKNNNNVTNNSESIESSNNQENLNANKFLDDSFFTNRSDITSNVNSVEFSDNVLKDTLQDSLSRIKEKLKRINEEESLNTNQRENLLLKCDKKTILRDQKPIVTKSMSVDKWIEVHKRRNTKAAVELLNKNDNLKILAEQYKSKESIISEVNGIDDSNNSSKSAGSKLRSRRELSDMTVLDKVQNRIKLELQENLKKLRKIESQNEFNTIVAKIKNFLHEIEKFKYNNSNETNIFSAKTSQNFIQPKLSSSAIKLYEYSYSF